MSFSMSKGVFADDGTPVRESGAACDECGAIGTVGRATCARDGHAAFLGRFCLKCWPEKSAQLEARWKEEYRLFLEAWRRSGVDGAPPLSMHCELAAATWHFPLEMLAAFREQDAPMPQMSAETRAALADHLSKRGVELEGNMPFEVEVFISRYRSAT